ncbi:histidine kinase dimerization/phosphoacceptor domain -containing protein [Methanosarcina hadiensis]|uniref:histidine kinase dimerization/phosphoacceptor domain -containing protein n=1 Tax=Methanosarcina hadiensis TaxID=3078083 RepID=UPI003977D320
MSSKLVKNRKPASYEALLDENQTLRDEVKSLKAHLEEAEELKRAISEGDLDALVVPGPGGELIFTLDSADYAYRVLVETMNEGTATLACDGTILYCNPHFAEILKMPLHAIIGNSIYRFIAPENISAFRILLEKERGKAEINLQTEEKASLPVYLSISSLQVKEAPDAWCLVVTDLTEQKKNEEIITKIESARKKEIHHRIKNNLQVISSLLDLQAEQFINKGPVEDSEILEAFRVSQDRVISMSLIHEELHEGGEIDTLNFSPYLERLVKNLLKTYSLGDTEISLNMDLEENVFFDMDTAVPLGLVVNELVSNSLKYAFPGRSKGKIQIKLFKSRDGNKPGNVDGKLTRDARCGKLIKEAGYTLIISDNGIGIPENIDLENSDTLGLQLVNILIGQLEGEIHLKRDRGTEFKIEINVRQKICGKDPA